MATQYSMGKGLPGGIAANTPPLQLRTGRNAEESDGLQFGYAVALGDDPQGAIIPADSTDKIIGVVNQNHQTANDYIEPNEEFAYLAKGDVFVVTAGGVSPDEPVYVHTKGGGTNAGKFGTASEGTDSVLLSDSRWLDETNAAGIAKLSLTIY